MPSIQARFWVRSVEKFAYAKNPNGRTGWAEPKPLVTVKLTVVTGGRAPENAQWATATPSGEITMTIGDPAAAAWFESMLGEDVAVSFAQRRGEL